MFSKLNKKKIKYEYLEGIYMFYLLFKGSEALLYFPGSKVL
jgi:hypothetical protein